GPVRRPRSRSPTGGTCGTTWPSTWRRPSRPTTGASGNTMPPWPRPPRSRLLIPARPQRPRPAPTLKTGPAWCGPVTAMRGVRRGRPGTKAHPGGAGVSPGRPAPARRYSHAARVDEVGAALLTGWAGKRDEHKPFLHQRWNAGCGNIQQLHREITARGYRGSYGAVYAYLRPFKAQAAPPAIPAPPKVRHITSWILRDPATLDDDEPAR